MLERYPFSYSQPDKDEFLPKGDYYSPMAMPKCKECPSCTLQNMVHTACGDFAPGPVLENRSASHTDSPSMSLTHNARRSSFTHAD